MRDFSLLDLVANLMKGGDPVSPRISEGMMCTWVDGEAGREGVREAGMVMSF